MKLSAMGMYFFKSPVIKAIKLEERAHWHYKWHQSRA